MTTCRTIVKMDEVFNKKMNSIRKEVAQVMVSIVAKEFVDLLHNAPQYSGNFVANMAVQSGTRGAGAKGGNPGAMPPLSRRYKDIARAVARGSLPAINYAKGQNANLKENLTAHITKSAGWVPGLTVYNRLAKAGKIESLGPRELREVNREGAHAMAKFGAKLEGAFASHILYEGSEWHKYLGANYL